MHMTFYWGTHATLLFDGWVTRTLLQYYLSLVAILVFAVVHEWLFMLRVCLTSNQSTASGQELPDQNEPLLDKSRRSGDGYFKDVGIALMYGVNASTGYLLMLLVMSFNGGVFLSVIAGLVIGYALLRSKAPDRSIYKISDPCCVG